MHVRVTAACCAGPPTACVLSDCSPGDMVLLTAGKGGPLVGGGWDENMMYGVVTERSRNWIKVAFETGPDKSELQDCDTWR